MIQLIDQAMEQFLRAAVPLPEGNVDLSFEAPDKTWGASITRPTVNVFLWDIRRNAALNQAGLATHRAADGQVGRQQAPVVIDLRYLITAWAADHRDEHELLGAVLRCVLRNPVLPGDAVTGLPDEVGTVRMALSAGDHDTPDFWSALEGRVKPGIEVDLTMAVDLFDVVPAGPPVRQAEVGVGLLTPAATPDPVESSLTGSIRRSRRGGRLIAEGRDADATGSNGSNDSESAQS